MTRKIRAKDILRMAAGGLSGRAIADALGVSRNSVGATLAAAEHERLSWEDAEQRAAPEVYEALFPEKANTGPAYPDPDWEHIHRELAREGVTLDYCITFATPFHAAPPHRSTVG